MSKPQILLLGEIEQYECLKLLPVLVESCWQEKADTTPLYSAHKEWSSLSSIAEIIEPQSRSREEFIEECKKGAFEKVTAAYRTFQSVAITGLIDEELIAVLPKSLKFIAHNGMPNMVLRGL